MLSMWFFFVCVVVGDFIFVVGGYDNMKMVLVFVECYDLKFDFWEVLLRMYEFWDECMGVILDGKFYVISGYYIVMQCKYVKSVEVYDFVSCLWLQIENMIDVSFGVIVSVFGGCYSLYVIYYCEVFVYCFKVNKWCVFDILFVGDDGILLLLCVFFFGWKFVVIGICNDDEENYRIFLYELLELIMLECLKCKGVWEVFFVDVQFLGVIQIFCVVELQ